MWHKPREAWRWIKGYKELYKVSNWGNVKSVERWTWGGPIVGYYSNRGTFLSPGLNEHGYPIVILSKNGRLKTKKVAHLVLEAFVGPRPSKKHCACHFPDKDPSNNCVWNLRWDTRKGNEEDKEFHGTKLKGEKHPKSKLTKLDVEDIRDLYKTGRYFQWELAKIFNCSQQTVCAIINYKLWK